MERAKLKKANGEFAIHQDNETLFIKIETSKETINDLIKESFRKKCNGNNPEIDDAYISMSEDLTSDEISDQSFNAADLSCIMKLVKNRINITEVL